MKWRMMGATEVARPACMRAMLIIVVSMPHITMDQKKQWGLASTGADLHGRLFLCNLRRSLR